MSEDNKRRPLQWNVDHRTENGDVSVEMNSAVLDSGKKILSAKIMKKGKDGRDRFLVFKPNELESLSNMINEVRYQIQAEQEELRQKGEQQRGRG